MKAIVIDRQPTYIAKGTAGESALETDALNERVPRLDLSFGS